MGDTTRKMRTPEERIAAAQAQLEELKAKAETKDRKRYGVLDEQRAKLVAQIEELTAKVETIDDELVAIVERVPELGQPSTPALTVVSDDDESAAV